MLFKQNHIIFLSKLYQTHDHHKIDLSLYLWQLSGIVHDFLSLILLLLHLKVSINLVMKDFQEFGKAPQRPQQVLCWEAILLWEWKDILFWLHQCWDGRLFVYILLQDTYKDILSWWYRRKWFLNYYKIQFEVTPQYEQDWLSFILGIQEQHFSSSGNFRTFPWSSLCHFLSV